MKTPFSDRPAPLIHLALIFGFLALLLVGSLVAFGQTAPATLPAGMDPQTVAVFQMLQQMQQANNGSTIAAPVAGGALSSLIAVFGGILAIRQFAPILLGAPLEEIKREHVKVKSRVIRNDRDNRDIRQTVHWLAQCQLVIAEKLGAELPIRPPPVEHEDDSDEETPAP